MKDPALHAVFDALEISAGAAKLGPGIPRKESWNVLEGCTLLTSIDAEYL